MNPVPEQVLNRLRFAVDRVKLHQEAIEQCRKTDTMFGGDGRYESEYHLAHLDALKAPMELVETFRELAKANGVEPEEVLIAVGWSEELLKSCELTEKAREWIK